MAQSEEHRPYKPGGGDEALGRFLSLYGGEEPIQAPEEAHTDPELNTVFPSVADRISSTPSGTIIDIGCGNGILLERLADCNAFKSNPGWIYIAVGTDDNLVAVQAVARRNSLNRRLEPVLLDDFYEKWPSTTPPQIAFCRNVLHELDISETATLLLHAQAHLAKNDPLLIQDLLVLPKAEQHSVCWLPEQLSELLGKLGFIAPYPQAYYSPRGHRWFNLTALAGGPPSEAGSPEAVAGLVYKARSAQAHLWDQAGALRPAKGTPRDPRIELADFDLQFGRLNRQLREHEPKSAPSLDAEQEKSLRAKAFTQVLEDALGHDKIVVQPLKEIVTFRDRETQLADLEEFLRGEVRLAAVVGGRGYGKSALVRHLLATRSYEKCPIHLAITQHNISLWPLVETFMTALGTSLPAEHLAYLGNLQWGSVELTLKRIARHFARRTIVWIDDFHWLLNSNYEFQDKDVASFLALLLDVPGAKVILTSVRDVVPKVLLDAQKSAIFTQVRVGRFADDETVTKVLDDEFDRGSAGIKDYPDRLIRAIDRHPSLASLAGRHLRKSGTALFNDEVFIKAVENGLREYLWNRLVDDESRPALQAFSHLRVAIPKGFLEKFCPVVGIAHAQAAGLLYEIDDPRWTTLMSGIGAFRLWTLADEPKPLEIDSEDPAEGDATKGFDHVHAADLYTRLYKADDNPKWIRESYFHRIVSGQSDLAGALGAYYHRELLASAHYSYQKKKDYREALELYLLAGRVYSLGETASMRYASCLIRTGAKESGQAEFDALISRYPNNQTIKMAHVDALLYKRSFEESLELLQLYELRPANEAWVAGQYGRAYFGLGRYFDAEKKFKKQLDQTHGPEPLIFWRLARAIAFQGDYEGAVGIIEQGLKAHPGTPALQTLLGVYYDRIGKETEAEKLFAGVLVRDAGAKYAARGLARIFSRSGRADQARATLKRCRDHVPSNDSIVMVGFAELEKASGYFQRAIEQLHSSGPTDQDRAPSILECYLAWAESASEGRPAIAKQGLDEPISFPFREDAQVLLLRARLAALAGEPSEFESMIKALNETKISRAQMADLDSQWLKYNPA